MIDFVDCSGCGCLLHVGDRICPFCHSRRRRADLPALLLGCMLGLATIGCTDHPDDTSDNSDIPSGVTYAAPPPTQWYYGDTTDAVTDSSIDTSTSSASSGQSTSTSSGDTDTEATGTDATGSSGATDEGTAGTDTDPDTDTSSDDTTTGG